MKARHLGFSYKFVAGVDSEIHIKIIISCVFAGVFDPRNYSEEVEIQIIVPSSLPPHFQ